MINLKDNVFNRKEKILTLKMSSRMDSGGRRFGQSGAREFDYRQRAKDVPTFHGSMNVEDFLDRMSELDTFFKFYEIPMGSRVDLVAYKLKGVLNLGGKICNSFVNDKANYLSLVGKEWSGSYVEGHRSNDCKANGGKVNLTLRDDEFGNGGETNTSNEDVDAEICHPEGGDYPSTEYSTHSFVIQHILLASKVTDSSQRHNLFKTRCIIFQKVINVIIDNGSTENIVSRDIVQQLRLPTKNIPTRTKKAMDVRCKCNPQREKNTYTFHHDGVKMVLVSLSDGYNTNVSSSAECSVKGTGSVEAK
nr:zf-CCHC domain-containing protein [Tanacetum cinerariifolium]